MGFTYDMETFVINTSAFGQLTDEQFFDFCQQNRDLRMERTADGQIIIMTPTGGITGNRNSEISRQLANWNVQYKKGVTFDSSAGFTLPDTSVLSPDASWMSKERWEALSIEQQEKFPPLCPDFVIELRSKTDNLTELQKKMTAWIQNGCQLAWLIDPENEQVFIYKPGREEEKEAGFDNTLSGEDVLPGFSFDLQVII